MNIYEVNPIPAEAVTESNVVLHDTAKPESAALDPKALIANTLTKLVEQREQWEQNAFRTSNDQLYALLQSCYSLYKSMEGTEAGAKALRDQLNSYIAEKGYKFKKSTHTIAKLIKCVFGVDDRRRISSYTIVLKQALSKNVGVMGLADHIRKEGGVEEIRLSRSPTALTTKDKAKVAANAVTESMLGTVRSDALGKLLDAGKIDHKVLLIGTWKADGSVDVHALVDSDTALNAALVSQYSAIKTAEKEKVVAQAAAVIADAKQQAMLSAVAAATVVV